MLGNTYEGQNCSAARALEMVGERWSLLIIRTAIFAGVTRFNDFLRRLGLARNILAARLDAFVEAGLMERRPAEESTYLEYHLTDKGRDLAGVVVALTEWGDRWAAPHGPPIVFRHADCGGHVETEVVCRSCGRIVPGGEIEARPGPGFVVA